MLIFRQLFDAETSTYTYLLGDSSSREAVLIDPVIGQVERDLEVLKDLELKLVYALDTHVHADHVTAIGTLRQRTGCQTILSERAGVGCADLFVKQGDTISFGAQELWVRETPGHTNGCLSFVLDDQSMVFTGDALLIRGSGRTDFQGGDATTLYRAIHQQIFSLPDACLIYPGHDYKGRTVSTVGEEKRLNPRVGGGKSEAQFVEIMKNLQLPYPKKIDEALPMNLQCGVPRGVPAEAHTVEKQDWAPIAISAGGVPEVPAEWVSANIGAFRLVDVRERDELSAELGMIKGAEHLPLANIAKGSAAWSKTAPVVLVCRSGGRSGNAALQLRALGFGHVVSMAGGMTAWNHWRLPTIKGAADQASAIHRT